jgi:hypothetical protein
LGAGVFDAIATNALAGAELVASLYITLATRSFHGSSSRAENENGIGSLLTLTALHIFCVFYENPKYFLSNQAINKKIFIKCAILRNSRNPL